MPDIPYPNSQGKKFWMIKRSPWSKVLNHVFQCHKMGYKSNDDNCISGVRGTLGHESIWQLLLFSPFSFYRCQSLFDLPP